ncbi:MAG: 1,4-dihydroxy-2-naphthoate polyprenyltransferase [Chlorobiales bacterium]|jgi:1,4-dihydroxy-2-naphthoate polyprenyltransferase|nr:1,4-dihydroxy-2-naphthoate polyprenyltransferase [Chlorobiales bacterium]
MSVQFSDGVTERPGQIQVWINAIRPKTLPAGILPVVIGSALAYTDKKFAFLPALVALLCATLIQITTNFINEIYDHRKGADTPDRLGPVRAVATGLIPEKTMIRVSISVVAVTFLVGLYLVVRGGLPVLLIGIVSLVLAWAYTGGPFPLAYKGLGDIFVFIFFGVVAVTCTYYVQALELSTASFVASISPGALATNILGINNIRDIPTDTKVNKRTLAVRIGAENARRLYVLLTASAFIAPAFLYFQGYGLWVLLPFLSLPLAISIVSKLYRMSGKELNELLGATGKLMTIHGFLLSAGLILSALT